MSSHLEALGAKRFAHVAMATEFEIFCAHPDSNYAQQAAWQAFDLLDKMEHELSRFIENSDISRINELSAGESVRVCRWTMDCLTVAKEARRETQGAFDISLGTGMDNLRLTPANLTVQAMVDGVKLDLGGIGKGYAVDHMAEVLKEWDIHRALIHGGHSSVLALDAPEGHEGWTIGMGASTLSVAQLALSASGIRKGSHIVDPRTGEPVRDRRAAWVTKKLQEGGGPAAAEVEAYSTAFMILPVEQIEAICARHGMEAWLDDGVSTELRKILCVQHSD